MRSNKLFIDSFNQRSREKIAFIKAKKIAEENSAKIGQRITELKNLVYESLTPQVYHTFKPVIKSHVHRVGNVGGNDFEDAKTILFNSRDSEYDWDIAVNYFTR